MNCSQLLDRRATTNWEKSASTFRHLTERLSELGSAIRPWVQPLSPDSSPSDSNFTQKPMTSARSR
jgi:hypothetical protein